MKIEKNKQVHGHRELQGLDNHIMAMKQELGNPFTAMEVPYNADHSRKLSRKEFVAIPREKSSSYKVMS